MMASVVVVVMVVVVVIGGGDVACSESSPTQPDINAESQYWNGLMQEKIRKAIGQEVNTGRAKNIVLFVGDGLRLPVSTAARLYKGQQYGQSTEQSCLLWDKFPYTGLLKNYGPNTRTPASTANLASVVTGFKVRPGTLGVANVEPGDCVASLRPENQLDTILDWVQQAGMDTGIVTTHAVTIGTSAALYAKSARSEWECNDQTEEEAKAKSDCKDTARQLIEDEPGRNIKVVLGGGRRQLGAEEEEEEGERKNNGCKRGDGRNLVEEWKKKREEERKGGGGGGGRGGGGGGAYVTTTSELMAVNISNTDYLMGLFAGGRLPQHHERARGPRGTPSLALMAVKALALLKKSQRGFFLMVEDRHIGAALRHSNMSRHALEEVLELERAVLAVVKRVALKETLLVVLGDRGSTQNTHEYYLTFHDHTATIMNDDGDSTADMDDDSRGWDDAVYAAGPMSQLVSGVHENTYMAHIMAVSACVGPYAHACPRPHAHAHTPESTHENAHASVGTHAHAHTPESTHENARASVGTHAHAHTPESTHENAHASVGTHAHTPESTHENAHTAHYTTAHAHTSEGTHGNAHTAHDTNAHGQGAHTNTHTGTGDAQTHAHNHTGTHEESTHTNEHKQHQTHTATHTDAHAHANTHTHTQTHPYFDCPEPELLGKEWWEEEEEEEAKEEDGKVKVEMMDGEEEEEGKKKEGKMKEEEEEVEEVKVEEKEGNEMEKDEEKKKEEEVEEKKKKILEEGRRRYLELLKRKVSSSSSSSSSSSTHPLLLFLLISLLSSLPHLPIPK
ncbi:alkaline phosphatase-like isoform X3 [Eriocheir sinensis]|uniref:alkaline phosphatase-like isoform X3 n=1 Tax=Eriocheir sinensis TaxID=95602 RepID=UPI0021C8CF59|nr:alkaline phosphatase-like isoform X3 [Eriocheir sinensis]